MSITLPQNYRPTEREPFMNSLQQEYFRPENAREEFLCQFARRILVAPLALKEAEDGLVVAFAQFT